MDKDILKQYRDMAVEIKDIKKRVRDLVVFQIKRAFDLQIFLAEKEAMIDFPSHCRNTVSHIIRN